MITLKNNNNCAWEATAPAVFCCYVKFQRKITTKIHMKKHFQIKTSYEKSFTSFPDLIAALSNVHVTIPSAVKRSENAVLRCDYDTDSLQPIYTIKWYRKSLEFYRFTPKENPSGKHFAVPSIKVDMALSNATHVFLRNLTLAASGRYSCEVSMDAPTFDTAVDNAILEVVELPTQRPIINGIHSRYRLGDVINGNCSSEFSKPAANLTWWINDIQVPPNYVRNFEIQKNAVDKLETSVQEINFIVTLPHFIKGRLRLKCSARIYDLYAQESEKFIEEDRPRILASGRSPDMNMYPFDQHTGGDELSEHNEMYLTHYNNLPSSGCSLIKNVYLTETGIVSSLLVLLLSCIIQQFSSTLLAKNIVTAFQDFSTVTNTLSNNSKAQQQCNEYSQKNTENIGETPKVFTSRGQSEAEAVYAVARVR